MLILVVAPSVPVAAAGVSLVLERVGGVDEVGKWVRTGDTQRFRVRLNGMGRGARVAVAASPVEALTEVACGAAPGAPGVPAGSGTASSFGTASGSGMATDAGTAARVGTASVVGAVPKVGGTSHVGVAGALTMRALSVVGGSRAKGAALPGTRLCALGKVSGERAVDVTLKTPVDAEDVVLAAVARVRDIESGGLTTMSRTAAVRSGKMIAGDAATFSGPAHRLRPKRPGTVRPDGTEGALGTSPQALPQPVRTAPAPASAPATAAPARGQASPARAQGSPAHVQASPARVQGSRARGPATLARAQGSPARAQAAPRRVRAATVPRPAASLAIPSAVPSAVPSAIPSAVPSAIPSAIPSRVPSGLPSAIPSGLPSGIPSGVPSTIPSGVPRPLATISGAASPSPVVSFQPEAAAGEAPLPWGMVVSAKPVEPVRWDSPIDGPKALPMVLGGIGVLMAALWAVVTVQRGRNRRKVL
ncbi:hypothetical protein ACWDA3_17380 [Nonomuraea rubra]